MKIIIDLDPKLQRKLEVIAHNRGSTISDVTAELLGKLLNRDSAASSSADGIPSPAAVDAAKKAAAATAAPAPQQPTMKELVALLEPLIARLRVVDGDGAQRRAVLADMHKLPQHEAVTRVIELLKASMS